jgi:hypothetical protein
MPEFDLRESAFEGIDRAFGTGLAEVGLCGFAEVIDKYRARPIMILRSKLHKLLDDCGSCSVAGKLD